MLSQDLEQTLNQAIRLARQERHEFITVEHLLFALLDNPVALRILHACGGDTALLRNRLNDFLGQHVPVLPPDQKQDTQPANGFQRVLQYAIQHVQNSGRREVTGANILVSIFREKESFAVFFLEEQDVSRFDIVNFLAHGVSKVGAEGGELPAPSDNEAEGEDSRTSKRKPTALESYSTNLMEQAGAGRIDPLIGREQELERTQQILCRRRKNNPLFVGEAGVGKTAIAEGLALYIEEGKVPEPLAETVIYALDMGALLAGTKYRGDFEQRLKSLLSELQEKPHAVLFIDEIHTLIGAGAISGGAMDASNLLKPLLASGGIKCIGSTTYKEYRNIFEKDRALSRRFQKIDVEEPEVGETVKILEGLRTRFEDHHNIRYTRPALRAAVELADKYISDRFLPDKAIDVIDEAGAHARLHATSTQQRKVGVREIERIVARMVRIPERNVSNSDISALKSLEISLKRMVFGQDEAIIALSSAIKMSRSGLGNPDKPIASLLFSGPTGVGKTEVSRQLAFTLGIELIRFDMSEYMERHAVSRLIGAPPGYVGFDQGGLLTDAITKHPHAVLLLDEIEKAHPDVFNLLLQVMDYGKLTDNNGRTADFRNIILIMTSNAGAAEISRSSVGFIEQDHSHDDSEAIRKAFTPEFRNRLDAVVHFQPLDHATVLHVVDKFLMQFEQQLAEKHVYLAVDDAAREWLSKRGHDVTMGARPMERLIQNRLKRAMADELLFGRLVKGGRVTVTVQEDDLVFSIEESGTKKRFKSQSGSR